MAKTLEEKAKEYIPAEIRMFSGCRDEETSADVSNVASFGLPDPAGKAGGACTTALLNILYEDERDTNNDYTFYEIIMKMRGILKQSGYTQIPQLSSSRPMDIKEKFHMLPPNFNEKTGTKRAVVIGINYTGMRGELSGCQNDAKNMISYIKKVHGFEDKNITILMDDGVHIRPTKHNILLAYRRLVAETKPGDAVFCHFAGHGGKVKDVSGDEDDGFDETMIPIDYQSAGQILDDELFEVLICPMPAGGDGKQDSMSTGEDFKFPHTAIVQRTRMKQAMKRNIGLLIAIVAAAAAVVIPYVYMQQK